jgi:hypothetical protein
MRNINKISDKIKTIVLTINVNKSIKITINIWFSYYLNKQLLIIDNKLNKNNKINKFTELNKL